MPEYRFPVSLNVTSLADPVMNDSLDFGSVFLGDKKRVPLLIYNNGIESFTISSASASNNEFKIASVPSTIQPGKSDYILLEYQPENTGDIISNLIVNGDIGISYSRTVVLMATAAEPPVMNVDTSGITIRLKSGSTTTRSLIIDNSEGKSTLSYNMLMEKCDSTFMNDSQLLADSSCNDLDIVLNNLNAGYQVINTMITKRYDFTDGITGYSIPNGGFNMYSNGNIMYMNSCSLEYSDNEIVQTCIWATVDNILQENIPGYLYLPVMLTI